MNDVAAREVAIEPTMPPVHRTVFYRAVQMMARIATALAMGVRYYGMGNIPKTGGVLLVSNHQSFLDPILIGCRVNRGLCFLARSGLFKPRYFGWLIRALYSFPVEQGKGDIGAMKRAIQLLQSGRMLLIFPEGARSGDGEMQPLAAGSALVIKRARVPVVPVAIEGAYDAWPRHRRFPRCAPVSVMVGKPIDIHDMDARQIVQRIEADIRAMIAELRLRERDRDPWRRLKQNDGAD